MAVLDAYGRPYRPARMRREIAGPTVTGLRSVWSDHQAYGLTPGHLAVILREAEQGDARAYLDLAEAMEERDLHYLSVLSTRRRQVSQLNVTVIAADESAEAEADAATVRDWLARTELEDEIFEMLDAVAKGYSVLEIIWDISERQWLPARLEYRLPRWFEFDWRTGSELLLRGDPREASASGGDPGLVPLEPGKFIVHRHAAKSGIPIRGGLARAAAWGWLAKNYTLRDWVRFVDAYGQPLRVGRYHTGSTPEQRDTLLRAVRDIASDASAIIPEGMAIDFIDVKNASAHSDVYRDLLTYIDGQISKAVLGQTLTTDAGQDGSGSYALGRVHDEVRHDIERADARQVAATLTRDLVRPIVALNRGDPGLRGYPRIEIGRDDRRDPAVVADVLARLPGLRVDAAEVRALLGFSDPAPDAEILGGPPAEGAPAAPPEMAAARARLVEALAAAARPDGSDAIGRAVAGLIDDAGWEPLMEPVIDPVLAGLADAGDLVTARARLADLMDRMDDRQVAGTLRRMGLAAHLSGAAGLAEDADG